jgi:predicted transposase YbfD/YdcC
VFDNLENIDTNKWAGMRSLVKVERTTLQGEKTTEETAYFISSLPCHTSAHVLNMIIRSHWSIESFHYIKDVVMGEDRSKVRIANAPANYSIIRNFVINTFRKNNLHNIQETLEKCANNVPYMLSLF